MAYPIALLAALTLTFVSSGSYFSTVTHQGTPLDPQVFVKDASPPQNPKPGDGPQNIVHEAGMRPALLGDDAATPLYNADGTPLGFSAREWFGAQGVAQISAADAGSDVVTASFYGLIPNADYSLFEAPAESKSVDLKPLDGNGATNSFVSGADGRASITVTVPHLLTHADAIVLVYHSDNQNHGASPGNPGYTAHAQLAARVP